MNETRDNRRACRISPVVDRRWQLWAMPVAATVGGILIFVCTWYAVGVGTDSLAYLRLAGLIRTGNFSALKTDVQFPPLYPLAIAFASFITDDALLAARCV